MSICITLINIPPLIQQSKTELTHSAYHPLYIHNDLSIEEHFNLYNLSWCPNLGSFWNSASLHIKTYGVKNEQISFFAAGDKCPLIEINLNPDDNCVAIKADSSSQSYLKKTVYYKGKASKIFEQLSKEIKYSGYYYPKLLSSSTYSKLLLKYGTNW
jgi:hypothetical protein